MEILTEMQQKHKIRKIIRRKSYPNMDAAKDHIRYLINIAVIRTPTVNDFVVGSRDSILDYGNDWGWPNLYWDILSAKYGAKAIQDRKTGKTRFSVQLPPVEKLTKG